VTKTAKYTNAEQTSILWNDGNREMTVPNQMGNRHRLEIQEWVDNEGGVIESYVAPPTYPTKAAALQAVNEFAQSFTEGITGPVPLDEKLSWDAKEAAAKAVIAGTATAEQQSLLDDEAALTSETTTDLANTIVAKATVYRQVVSRVAGLRRVLTTQIEAETDPYNYEAILLAGQTQAQQLADSLGL
jgi:hypothetical protein